MVFGAFDCVYRKEGNASVSISVQILYKEALATQYGKKEKSFKKAIGTLYDKQIVGRMGLI